MINQRLKNQCFFIPLWIAFFVLHVMIGLVGAQQAMNDNIHQTHYEDGTLKTEETLRDGSRDGVYKSYYLSGSIKSTGNYRAGKKDGLFKKFYENGQMMFKAVYRMGKIVDMIKMYDDEGRLIDEWDAEKEPTGIKRSKPFLQKLTLDKKGAHAVFDLQKEYYLNGNLKAEKFYKNSQLDGIQKEYDEQGNLKFSLTYQDGQLILQEDFSEEGALSLDAPSDLLECFALLEKTFNESELIYIKEAIEEELRDQDYFLKDKVWSLWTNTPLTEYFRDLGIYHPDDMGSIVFVSFRRHLNNEEMRLDQQIKGVQHYWESIASGQDKKKFRAE